MASGILPMFECQRVNAWSQGVPYWEMDGMDRNFYPMLRADSRFWLVNNREIWAVSYVWRHKREI